jgi:EpsI family protein
MTTARWRALFATLVMAAGAVLSTFGKPTIFLADQIGKPDLEVLFPKEFTPWKLDTSLPTVLPSPDVQAQINKIYNQVLSRTYVNPEGQRVMLSVAYGGDQSDGTSAHRPEVCYPAQGFEITANQKVTANVEGGSLAVRRLMAKLNGRMEPITYWVIVGNEAVTSGVDQKLAQMRFGLRGVIADGMLVRVSSLDPDMAHGYAVQSSFIAALAAALPIKDRTRIFGVLAR